MRFVLHGTNLALAWFLVSNVVLSVTVAILTPRIRHFGTLLLVSRLLPAVLSLVFVVGIFVPSYWRFEPREAAEGFDLTLTILAGAAIVLLGAGIARGMSACALAARRIAEWAGTATPLSIDLDMPALHIDAPEPFMALVGIARPRLLVTRGLVEALTRDELTAAIAHEVGHRRSWDNLKRLAIRGAPDILRWLPAAQALERGWAEAAEHRADAAVLSGGEGARLALASALVKIARLMPVATPVGEPISALVSGGGIAARVERLLQSAPDTSLERATKARWALVTCLSCIGFALTYTPLLARIHDLTELAVRHLP